MTNGINQPGFGTWPPGAPVFEKLGSTLQLFLDPVNGRDARSGLSRRTSVQSPRRIADLIAMYPGNVDVHMRSGAAVLPERGWFLLPRMFGGLVRFIADESWDPAVYTVVGGNRIAEAATAADVIKASGLTVDALQDASVRFTTGAAAGQYRRVRNNTATDIVPSTGFDPAPSAGDTYQIITSNAYFVLPNSAADVATNYVFCSDSPGVAPLSFDGSYSGGPTMLRPAGVLFDGVGLRGGTGYYYYFFGATSVYFFGTDADTDFLNSSSPISCSGSVAYSGFALPDYLLKQGWGFAGGGMRSERAMAIGCWHMTDFWSLPTFARLFGGRYEDINASDSAAATTAFISSDWATGAIVPLLGSVAGSFALQLNSLNSAVDIQQGVIRGLFQVVGCNVYMSATVTSPIGVEVNTGGRLAVYGGVPNVGGAGNDWHVTGLANFNKSFFAAPGTIKFGTDGSCAQRVS